MKILGTGLDGLVGSRIVELLKDKYEFESSEVDITDRNKIIEKIRNSSASIVLHLAAKTSVDGCEKDREKDIKHLSLRGAKNERRSNPEYQEIATPFDRLRARNDKKEGWVREKTAWAINVFGTQNVSDACQENKKKLIYISTDFVFDGSRPPAGATSDVAGGYKEDDKTNPINWYGRTKYEGEEIVKKSSIPWIVVRIAYPYRANFVKKDFVRGLIKKFQNKENLQMVTDHVMTPTFIDDVAYALDALIKNNSTGIYHVVGSEFISPYGAALKIANVFNFDQKNIIKMTRSKFFKNRASRPFHSALKNDKIQSLGVKMRGFEEGLKEVKSQMSKRKSTS